MLGSQGKSMLHHDVAHHTLTNTPATYELPTPHSFQDRAQTRFYGHVRYGKIKGQIKIIK